MDTCPSHVFGMTMKSLGNTGIKVSRLCFGALTMTPFQANLSIKEGAELIIHARDRGVNFLDTAEIYDNYEYIREALKSIKRDEFVISTKTYAYDIETAEKSLNKALKELNTDYIDLFLLHEQESQYTLKGHYEALEYLFKAKEKGYIKAVGVSTHFINCVEAALKYKEIQVVHPILNYRGIGIQDGSIQEMVEILKVLKSKDIGIYTMKALGGGHLISNSIEAINWVKNLDFVDSIAIGMQSIEEINFNADLVLKDNIDEEDLEIIKKKNRKLIIADYCRGCGNCESRCKQKAIKVIDGQAVPNEDCILCGYCATVCPDFCIKVI